MRIRARIGWATRLPDTDSCDNVTVAGCHGEASYSSSFLTMSWYILLARFLLACLMISCCMGFGQSPWLELAPPLALFLASVFTLGLERRSGLGWDGLLDLLASELQISLSIPVSSSMTKS